MCVCVGAAGFVLSHTLTFGFMWDSVSAAVEAPQPLGTDRFERLAEVVMRCGKSKELTN